jgi:hypothetical protein
MAKHRQRKLGSSAENPQTSLFQPDSASIFPARYLTRATSRSGADAAAAELTAVLSADYREAPGLPDAQLARQLASLAKAGIDPGRDEWRKWRRSGNYRITPRVFDAKEVAVHTAPYTSGAGLSLWGFSCDTRNGDAGVFVIFLNTAHQPGAVAATFAHELGHYVHSRLVPRHEHAPIELSPMAPNFAAHLRDPRELFSDSLVALAAYDREAVAKPRDRAGESLDETIALAGRMIRPEYRIDFGARRLSRVWRTRYLAATIHFFKLRRALLETAGV